MNITKDTEHKSVHTKASHSRRMAWTATAAIAGIAAFPILVVVLHVLRPDLSPITRFLSEYARGPYGFLMTIAILALGLGCLALLAGLAASLPKSGTYWVGLVLLGVGGLGFLIGALFPTDLVGSAPTPSGVIHNLASLVALLSLSLATLLLSLSSRQDKHWPVLLVLAVLTLVAFIGFFLSPLTIKGLSQRFLFALLLSWLLLAASHLRSAIERKA